MKGYSHSRPPSDHDEEKQTCKQKQRREENGKPLLMSLGIFGGGKNVLELVVMVNVSL